jgi:uncharacterized protein (TIGR03083 family)
MHYTFNVRVGVHGEEENRMTLSREVVIPGMLAEYQAFGQLVRGLSDEDWDTPSRCEGWRVADVAAHVIGQLTDVAALRLDGLGTPEVTARQVEEHRGRTPGELADELDSSVKQAADLAAAFDDAAWESAAPAGVTGTLGFGIEALWFDTSLHADDIRSALGRLPSVGDALAPSLSHISQVLTDQGWGPADLALDGFEAFPVSGGGGRTVSGDAYGFVLASTGRGDTAAFGLDESVNIYR